MEKLTKKDEEIQNVVRACGPKHKSFKYEPSKGITGIQTWAKENKQMDPVANHKFTLTQLRQAMNQEEYGNPAFAHLTYDRVCKDCGEKLTYDERMGKLCKSCSAKREEARRKAERDAAIAKIVNAPGKNIVEKVLSCNPEPYDSPAVIEAAPQKSTVTFLTPEEQADSVCRVSTIHDLMRHAPDRAIVMVNIENYSPTINYYSGTHEKK